VGLAAVLVVAERLLLGLAGWLLAGPMQAASPALLSSLVDRPGTLAGAVVGPWQRDDGLWYQLIAQAGYGAHPADAAFFPLYPDAIRTVGVLLGGAYGLAGLLVSTAALFVALVLLHRLVAADFEGRVARRTVIGIACAPFAFFLLAPFTEALFLMLSVATVLAARRRRFLVAGVCAGLATACRLQGLALMVPLLVEAVMDMRERRRGGLARGPTPIHAAVLLPLLSFGLLLLYLGRQTSLEGGFFAVESRYWSVHPAAPWTVLSHSLGAIAGGRHPEEVANLAVGLAVLALLPLMWRRLPLSYTLYTAALAVPLWFHENGYSPMMSAGRFSAVIFPVFVVAAVVITNQRAWRAMVAVMLSVMVAFFVNFTRYHFVG
ncbi:MAG: hypothetical protein ABR564_06420, partial [Candidatus Dormibacteria bacterium]